MAGPANRLRAALVGTGHRGLNMWGRGLVAGYNDYVELVSFCDRNPMRAERVRDAIGIAAPVFTDFDAMMLRASPEPRHRLHARCRSRPVYRRRARGRRRCHYRKAMATTVEKCRRIIAAQQRTGRRVDVAFNYRYSPLAMRIKQLLLAGSIGEVTSVDFHWYSTPATAPTISAAGTRR